MIELELSKLAFLFSKHELPEPIYNLFDVNSRWHNYSTRGASHPRTGKHLLSVYNKSFLCLSPYYFRNLNSTLQRKTSLKSFVNNFKKDKINTY